MSKKFSISSLFAKKRFVIVFSVVVAVIAWFIVSIQVSPTITKVISDVPIDFQLDTITTTTALKAYTGSGTKIKVSVSGKKYIVDSLTSDSVSVVASLENVTGSGTYTLSLVGRKNDQSGSFSIVSVQPSSVTVDLDTEATKTLPVDLNIVGATVATSQSQDETIVLENDLVNSDQSRLTVTGPSREISKIASAEVYSEVNRQLSESQQITARVRLFDADANMIYDPESPETSQLKNTELSYTTTAVMANVYLQKTVPLIIPTKNEPASPPDIKILETLSSGAENEQITTIRIKGPQAKIENITAITLDGILDFSTLDPSNPSTFTVSMKLPEYSDLIFSDYKNLSNVSFDVKVNYSGYSTKAYNVPDDNISVNITQSGISAVTRSSLRGITVVGPDDVLSRLHASDIYASVTLSESTPGTYVKSVEFKFKNHTSCWVLGTYELTVDIS